MKEDEKQFLICMLYKPKPIFTRNLISRLENEGTINHKRAEYLLQKWSDKGWYNYGVTLDLGWLTELGIQESTKVLNTYFKK